MDDNPLIQAMQMRKGSGGPDLNDPQALLEFILSKFDLVPKGNQEQEEPTEVMTQESHTP